MNGMKTRALLTNNIITKSSDRYWTLNKQLLLAAGLIIEKHMFKLLHTLRTTTQVQHQIFHDPLTIKVLAFLLLSTSAFTVNSKSLSPNSKQIELGRRIYMEGILPSGKPMQGSRLNSIQTEGSAAACETCHRRSGMGSLEGNIVVPPINGRFLFSNQENRPIALADAREPKNITRANKPYTLNTFNKLLNKGITPDGKQLNPLMPLYRLNKSETNALAAYLNNLSVDLPEGVGKDSLTFATVISPDVEQDVKEATIKMMMAAFNQRNASQEKLSGRMKMPIDVLPRTPRKWLLKVWELKGETQSWKDQLNAFQRQEPVFALISGLSNKDWLPVHDFCEQSKIPCLFPSIIYPPGKSEFYNLYYSRGIKLEAEVFAKYLNKSEVKLPTRILQLYDGEIGKFAAQHLAEILKASNVQIDSKLVGPDVKDIQSMISAQNTDTTVMLWLAPNSITNASKTLPELKNPIYCSGFIMKDKFPELSSSWKEKLRIIYPYELGNARLASAQALKNWLTTWQLPLVNEVIQSEVFFNTLLLTDLVSQMLDNLYRDYLIEKAEDMLSVGTNYSAYPRLSLAKAQRFASKGAYIARFGMDNKLVADTEWIVP
jgi:hypothetical protein